MRFLGGVDELDEPGLASPAGEDLGLDDGEGRLLGGGDGLVGLGGLIGGGDDLAGGDGDAVGGEEVACPGIRGSSFGGSVPVGVV